MNHVRDYAINRRLSVINGMYVSVWPRCILVEQCLLCRAIFINGKRVLGMYVETKDFCDHRGPKTI